MSVTEQVRDAIDRSGQTHYRIGKETSIDTRVLDRFVAGETDIRGATIDRLCEYFGLELCRKKGETAQKQTGKKPTAARKQPAKKQAARKN